MIQGIVYDIRSFSVHDGPGIRSTVFLKGCPLRCSWCHNPESQPFGQEFWEVTQRTGSFTTTCQEPLGRIMTVDEVVKQVADERPFFEESGGGVTLSGGEPLSQPQYCLELLKQLKKQGIHTALDTSGYAPAGVMDSVIPFTDLFLFDLKFIDPQQHIRHTGKSNQTILENFSRAYASGKSLIVRIPLVEHITDTDKNIRELKHFLAAFPAIERIDLLPYHCIARHKYQKLGRPDPLGLHDNYPREKALLIQQQFTALAQQVSLGG
ncbi:MAG: glycyl-radical enzyme activating protein [Bacteroidales bacterium]